MPRAWIPTVIAGVTAVAAVVSACGDSEPTTREAASAETATAVCGMLRQWNNEIGDVLNRTSDAITDADDPATAPVALDPPLAPRVLSLFWNCGRSQLEHVDALLEAITTITRRDERRELPGASLRA
jgi:hypothetical protein